MVTLELVASRNRCQSFVEYGLSVVPLASPFSLRIKFGLPLSKLSVRWQWGQTQARTVNTDVETTLRESLLVAQQALAAALDFTAQNAEARAAA